MVKDESHGRNQLLMMKKISAVIFVFMLTLFHQLGATNASELVITPKKDMVPIYDNRGGVLSEMGNMRLNEPLIVNGSLGANWWQVKFGNAFGYVNKHQVQVGNNVKIASKNKQSNTNKVVLINKDIDIYDNSSGALKKFAFAKAGYRYPVLEDIGNWWKVDAGGRVGFLYKASTSVDKGVPILMYHHFLSAKEKADSQFADKSTTVINTQFNEQMDFLKKNGFTTISTKDLERYMNRQVNLPAKSVVITIDDGNISSRIYAYPKLKEHGFVADQFIITSRTPKTPHIFNHKTLHFLSQQEMDAMVDVYNYHGHTHELHSLTDSNKSFVTAMNRNVVKRDLLLNRSLLNNTTYFAYPFGQYTNDTVSILRETGFTMAYTTRRGRAQLGMNKLLIPRAGIEPNQSIAEFAKIVNN